MSSSVGPVINCRTPFVVFLTLQAKALNNIRSATKSISEGIQASMEVNLDMAVEYIQVRHSPFVGRPKPPKRKMHVEYLHFPEPKVLDFGKGFYFGTSTYSNARCTFKFSLFGITPCENKYTFVGAYCGVDLAKTEHLQLGIF